MSEIKKFVEFVEFVTHTEGVTHIICLLMRPGVPSFMAVAENLWFPPQTPENELFVVTLLIWNDLLWAVVTIPTARMPDMRALAADLRMRLSEGAPAVIGGADDDPYFPGSDRGCRMNMVTIESRSDNLLHSTETPINHTLIHQREGIVLERLTQGARPTAVSIYNYIYGFDRNPQWLQP